VEGGILQMINHGVVTGALFLSVGIVYDRTHSRQIGDYGGLASVMPVYAGFFMLFTLASIGLPGTNGFIGEFLILLGTFKASKLAAAFAATGIIIGAGYMLYLYKRVFFDETNEKIVGLEPMNLREAITLVVMALFVVWIGVYPNAFLKVMHTSVAHLLKGYAGVAPEPMLAFKGLLGGLL
jgi:NADH-quinone oxidoreductase subunit M